MSAVMGFSNRAILLISLASGLALRAAPLLFPPADTTMWDHHEYLRWGRMMLDQGVTAIYNEPAPQMKMWDHELGRALPAHHDFNYTCNYPPLGVYLVYLEGWVFETISPEYVSNTFLARRLYAFLPVLGDLLTAWGCMALVRQLAGERPAHWAFAATFLLPPLIIDSTWWTQTDSWVLAPAVWMLVFMSSGQWLAAGLCWGLGLGLKPQSILLAATWLFALFVSRSKVRVLLGATLGMVTLFAASIPFLLTTGLRWLECSYIGNLTNMYPITSLNAFNIWYLDLLISENDDATLPLAGLPKDTWGQLLFLTGVVLAFWRLGRVKLALPSKLVAFTSALLLMAVLLPTRVHERYVVLPLPFLIAAASMGYRKLAPSLVVLVAAACLQITSLQWCRMGPQYWAEITELVHSQYETMRSELAPDEFAKIPTPEEQLQRDRIGYLEQRRKLGNPALEKGTLFLSLVSGLGCLWVLFATNTTGGLKEEAQRTGAGHQPDEGCAAGAAQKES